MKGIGHNMDIGDPKPGHDVTVQVNYHTPFQGGIWETNSTISVTKVTRECMLPERTWAR